MTFIFYDTETTGTDISFDQIVQFGAIRTDDKLNELDRFEIRCRLMPHVVPSPSAMQVTRVTPFMLTDPSLPSYFEATQLICKKMKEWSPATFFGYNSISFDENLMRQAFYQTLQPIYLTNTGGNSRGDVMRMLRATNIFAPNAIAVPLNDKGRPTFKLDTLAPANGFTHDNAHEAISDVEATIYMSKLMKDRTPGIWQNMLNLRSKQNVLYFINQNEVFVGADVYFGEAHSWLLTHCGSNPNYNAEFAAFDLSFIPDDYINLSVGELVNVLNGKDKPIRIFKSNSQPILMPRELMPQNTISEDITSDEIERRLAQIRNNREFKERVGYALAGRYDDMEPSPYVEKRIFDGFSSDADMLLMANFQSGNWEEKLVLAKQLDDPRLREMARRQIYFEQPDLLSVAVRQDLDEWVIKRLSTNDPDVPWRTIPTALKEADKLLEATNSDEAAFMMSVRKFILGLVEAT
jgi:exodeoxyribonuclease-1